LKQDIRSSVATFFTPEDEMAIPAILRLKQRAFAVTKIPYENQEELQMQRYREPRDANAQKDFYVPHYDSQPEHERKRVATLIMYLEEPEEGGETIFPMVHVNSTIRNKHLFSHTVTQSMAMNMWREGICEKAARCHIHFRRDRCLITICSPALFLIGLFTNRCFLSPPCDCKLFTMPWHDLLTANN